MKLITRDTDYAIRALRFIAKNSNHIVAVSALVEKSGIPRPFLRKILQILTHQRLLSSYKGQNGGFSLRADADKISLVNLMEIFQGGVKFNECTLKKIACPNVKTCKLKKKIDNIEKYVVSQLAGITIASLL